MNFIDPLLEEYATQHSSPEPVYLKDLNRETYSNVLMPRMLSGHLQGRFLSMISCMIRPRMILEIGTFTGYSALCLAEGLADNGVLHTIDINDELTPLVKAYISKAGFQKKIILHSGNAVNLIESIPSPFDLVFIDADKQNYSAYYDLVFEKVNTGGIIIADNVLWSGKIIDKTVNDKDTAALREFNLKINNDVRVENILLPLRDGLLIVRKK